METLPTSQRCSRMAVTSAVPWCSFMSSTELAPRGCPNSETAPWMGRSPQEGRKI